MLFVNFEGRAFLEWRSSVYKKCYVKGILKLPIAL